MEIDSPNPHLFQTKTSATKGIAGARKSRKKTKQPRKKYKGGTYVPRGLELERNLARTISNGANLQIDLIKLCPYVDEWFDENSQYLYDFSNNISIHNQNMLKERNLQIAIEKPKELKNTRRRINKNTAEVSCCNIS